MSSFTSIPGFSVFAVSILVLVLKVFAVTLTTPVVRAKAKVKVNPEDSGGELAAVEPDAVARMQRVVRNDLENIPLFCAVGAVAVLAGAGGWLLIGCSAAFVVARLLHTAFYLGKQSAPRTASYAVGVLSTLVLAFGAVVPLLGR
ncbi:MAG TPA: MAPEG family protein [Myxococcaceae bacterium]|jgi:uncharacterized MAPEG superfamily protein